jgi:hypothetical protein
MNATTSPAAQRRPGYPASRRAIAGAGAVIAAIGAAALTGCSASPPAPSPVSPPNGTTTAPNALASPVASVSSVSSVPSVPSSPGASASPQTSAAAAAAVPTLGRLAGVFAPGGQGFGQVKPAKIFNGGDPTGLVTGLTWSSWGGPQATGSGMSDYVGPNQSVATGSQKPVTVVAFKLGTCHGTLMYKAVEWYFPGEGQTFNPHQYENICTGSYFPAP